jgi:periplasmic protein TonB
MAAHAQDQTYIPSRIAVFIVIVALHVLLVWGLANGLAHRVVELLAPPIETSLIDEIKKQDTPPPPPPPKMERPPVEVPPPDVTIDIPVETTSTAITNVTDKPVVRPPPPAAVSRTAAKLDIKHSAGTEDYYPPTSRRMGEEGVTTVKACVSPVGKTSGDAEVARTSGFPRLDEAAVKWAMHARWTPATEDGKPVQSCAQFLVRFKLVE